jgi:hypothetical protein
MVGRQDETANPEGRNLSVLAPASPKYFHRMSHICAVILQNDYS